MFMCVWGIDFACTVIPVDTITSMKQSPVFKGHILLSCHRKFHMN